MAQKMIHIDGLRQFQRDLKTLSGDLAKALRKALNKGAEIVAEEARPRVPSRSGKARKSIKAASSQKEARVRGGGARTPYYPWLDFGGRVGRNRSVERRRIDGGRYLYPALADNNERVYQELIGALIEVAENANIEVEE